MQADRAHHLGRNIQSKDGEDVFSAGRSLAFKSLRVKRIYDEKNQVLIYLAHSSELSEGSAKMSISTIPIRRLIAPPAPEPAAP